MQPINLDEFENRALQSMFTEIKMDAQRRQYYPNCLDILTKLEAWPSPVILTEQENREIQYLFEGFLEVCKPYPYPYSPLTFSQPTVQVELCYRVLYKLKQAAS